MGFAPAHAAATGEDPAASFISTSSQALIQEAATGGDPASYSYTSPRMGFSPVHAATTGEDPAAPIPTTSSQISTQEAATSGDPASLALSSPSLSPPAYSFSRFPVLEPSATLDIVAQIWPAFGELRSAAASARLGRFRLAVGAMISEARVTFCAELLAARTLLRPHTAHSTPAPAIHCWARFLLVRGAPLLRSRWSWSAEQCLILESHLSCLVSRTPWAPCIAFPPPLFITPPPSSPAVPFPTVFCAFFHAIRIGCPWGCALRLFGSLADGHF